MQLPLQQGFTLIEVLVTLLILQTGLLGFLLAQMLALRQITTAIELTIAIAQSSSIL